MIARHILDNTELSPAVIEQLEVDVLATFDGDNAQANITLDRFSFIDEAYAKLKRHIDSGLILSPIPYKIQAVDGANQLGVFDGQIALWKAPTVKPLSSENKGTPNIEATVEKKDGLNSLFENLEALDWGFLDSEEALSTARTVEYVVEDYYTAIELIIIGAQVYAFINATIENTYKIVEAIGVISGILAAGITGSVGSLIYAAVQLAALLAYQAALAAALYRLIADIGRTYLIPKRTSKCQTYGALMRDALRYLGYTLRTNISELDQWAVMASNPNLDSLLDGFIQTPQGANKGYPRTGDPGNNCFEFFEIAKTIFNARYAVVQNEVWFYRSLAPEWRRNSTYRLPDLEAKPFTYNTDELPSIYKIEFALDYTDVFTLDRFRDSAFIKSFKTRGTVNTLKGRRVARIPYALAERKNSVNALEASVGAFISLANSVLGAFGLGFGKSLTNKVGSLKIGTNNWSVPKTFVLAGDKTPTTYKELNAQYLWDNYHFDQSPLAPGRQRLKYTGINVPFGLSDFQKTIENAYFRDSQGRLGKIEALRWNLNQDTAEIDYYIEEQYTSRINEKTVPI